MIVSDGYGIEYFPKANRIEIYLPQTMTTINNTVSMVSNRRTKMTDEEMATILAVVKAMMEMDSE